MPPGYRLLLHLAVVTTLITPACGDVTDPRAAPYFANPDLRVLMDWVSFRLTFDGDSMTPEMAAGASAFTPMGTPQFTDGVVGRALVCAPGSGGAIYTPASNATLATRGAVSLWVCPVDWTRDQGDNTVLVMTTNSSFYVQRQGPLHNPDGSLVRAEGLQFLMLSELTGNNCLMLGTENWPAGTWRLIVANWSWPVMQLSLDGGEFQSVTVKQSPTEAQFGGLIVGSGGGEKTLLDEVTFYRRPLSIEEVRRVWEAQRPQDRGNAQ